MDIIRKYNEFFHDTFAGEDFAICQGGKRAAKTTSILKHITLDLYSKRKRRALVVTDTFARLKDSILSDYAIISSSNPKLSKVVWSSTPRIDFFNGNSISFICADRDARGITSDKNWIFFNESIQYQENIARDVLKAGADDCKVFIDYNPYTRFWVNEKYETPTNKLITTYKDNPFCPKFAYDQLEKQGEIGKNAEPGTIERYIYEVECLGLNSDLSGLCFPHATTISDYEYDLCRNWEILGADWGSPLSNADPDVVCGFKFDGKRILCREYYYRNDGTDADIAEMLSQIKFKRQYFVFETATGGEARVRNIHAHNGLKFRYVPCTKGKGSVMIGIRNLQDYQLCITKSSLNFLKEQSNYKYVTKGDVMQPIDKWNHCFDVLRYVYSFWSVNKNKM